MSDTATATRPSTPPTALPGGGQRITVKRCCNGCSRELGDATEAELNAAVDGRPLPDVTTECGCSPAAKAAELAWYHYPEVYEQFLSEVAEHEMTVLHDDGLYRHLKFAKPGTNLWRFDIITWPGHLATAGDIGEGFLFRREPDMLPWFDHGEKDGEINPDYWSQKLARTLGVKKYNAETFTKRVMDAAQEYVDDHFPIDDPDDADFKPSEAVLAERGTFFDAIISEVLDNADDEHTSTRSLADFSFTDTTGTEHSFHDTWEWDFTEYDHHFLLACHAILWGAKKYHASIAQTGASNE